MAALVYFGRLNKEMTLTPLPVDRGRLAGRLRLAVTRLNRRLRQQAESGLSPSAQSALASIARHGPLSLGELANHESVKPPSVTATVAALEAAGLVRRETDATDRRVSLVAVTPRGKLRVQRSRNRTTAYLASRLSNLDDHDMEVLHEATGILERLLDEVR
jgi:DNA-binding MarR family transcriptional regulator